jgi:hypothetical protein
MNTGYTDELGNMLCSNQCNIKQAAADYEQLSSHDLCNSVAYLDPDKSIFKKGKKRNVIV